MTVVSTILGTVPLVLATDQGYAVWTGAALDAFLMSSEEFAPGTATTFIGLPDAKERLMAYLGATRDGLGRE